MPAEVTKRGGLYGLTGSEAWMVLLGHPELSKPLRVMASSCLWWHPLFWIDALKLAIGKCLSPLVKWTRTDRKTYCSLFSKDSSVVPVGTSHERVNCAKLSQLPLGGEQSLSLSPLNRSRSTSHAGKLCPGRLNNWQVFCPSQLWMWTVMVLCTCQGPWDISPWGSFSEDLNNVQKCWTLWK